MGQPGYVVHPFEPAFDGGSRVLILGSLPSPDSRRSGFYYGHARNRFWPVLAALTNRPIPQSVDQKRALLAFSGIALYDVIAACEICGASDASVKNAVAADLSPVFQQARIRAVFTNGKTAHALYQRHQKEKWAVPEFCLPSTSPANAAWSFERLLEAYRAILPYLADDQTGVQASPDQGAQPGNSANGK